MTDFPPNQPPPPGYGGPPPSQPPGWDQQPPGQPGWGQQQPPGQQGWGGPPPGGGSKGPNTGLIVVLGLLVAAVVAGGIFLVASGGDDDDEQSTDTTQTDDTTVSTEDNTPDSTEEDPSGEISDGDLADATDALDAFMAAELDSDCTTMYPLASETLVGGASQDQWVGVCQEEYDTYESMSVDGEAEVVGSTADSVDFEVPQTINDTELTATYTLVSENGQWLVEEFGSI